MERKLATVLFVDLVDHTHLVTGTDPEVNSANDAFNTVGDAGAFGRLDYYQIPPGRSVVVTLRTTF